LLDYYKINDLINKESKSQYKNALKDFKVKQIFKNKSLKQKLKYILVK